MFTPQQRVDGVNKSMGVAIKEEKNDDDDDSVIDWSVLLIVATRAISGQPISLIAFGRERCLTIR